MSALLVMPTSPILRHISKHCNCHYHRHCQKENGTASATAVAPAAAPAATDATTADSTTTDAGAAGAADTNHAEGADAADWWPMMSVVA